MSYERRLYHRVSVRLDVLWEGAAVSDFAEISDISLGGCYVRTAAKVSPGEQVTLDALLPRGRNIRLTGEVMHRQWPVGFGVRFTGLGSDEDYEELLSLTS